MMKLRATQIASKVANVAFTSSSDRTDILYFVYTSDISDKGSLNRDLIDCISQSIDCPCTMTELKSPA